MSTYSTRLQIELIGIGDQANAWGTTTNNNFSQSLEQSIAGVYSKNLSSGSTTTLTSTDGPQTQADNENRQAAIIFSGQTGNHTVQFTAKEKLYFLRNADTAYKVTCRLGSSGNTFDINPQTSVFLATNGTNWYELQTQGGTWITKTTTYTAYAGDKIFANTTGGAFTITLPASPSTGDEVRFVDLANTFDSNNLTVGRNSASSGRSNLGVAIGSDVQAFISATAGTNANGARTVSTSSPTGGTDGDIWYKYT